MYVAQHITLRLRGHWHGNYGLCFCPAHMNIKSPALSLSNGGQGRLLAHCFAGCSFVEIIEALKGLGLLDEASTGTPPIFAACAFPGQAQVPIADQKARLARTCWGEASPISGTLAETYLRSRGITCDLPDCLRFLRNCWHPTAKRFPAMVAFVDGVERFALHRTYLASDGSGKAAVNPSKAMIGAVAGGAVRLTDSHGPLVVAEGIETALSLASGLLSRPATIWAALSTSGLKGLGLPPVPSCLTIATDGDDAGRKAGYALAERASALGWKVSLLPAPHGRDWNDVLRAKGVVQ